MQRSQQSEKTAHVLESRMKTLTHELVRVSGASWIWFRIDSDEKVPLAGSAKAMNGARATIAIEELGNRILGMKNDEGDLPKIQDVLAIIVGSYLK